MDKATFLETLHTARAEWEALLAEVGEARMLEPGATGEWTVKDVIAHVMWCEREMVGVCEAHALAGSDLWNLTNEESNAIVVAQYRETPLQDVLVEERQVYDRLLAALQTLSDEDLNDARRFRDMPVEWVPWQLIAGNASQHYGDHMPPIRAWLDAK
jgi:DinB superfamily